MLFWQYELVRSSTIIKHQQSVLNSLAMPDFSQRRTPTVGNGTTESLSHLISTVDYYEAKLGNVSSAQQAMKALAREVDKDGLVRVKDLLDVCHRP